MSFKNLISFLVILVLFHSCSNSSSNDLTEDQDPGTTIVTYDGSIKAIITSNCTSCHGSPTTNGAPVSFTTFTQVRNNVDIIITRINSAANPMPASGLLPIAPRDLIQKWKDDGLLEN
jgi:cytochrome c peroxidase